MFLIKRDDVRHVALSALAGYYRIRGLVSESLRKNRVQIILLHSVLPGEVDGFRSILDVLSKYHHFISYSEAVKRIQEGNIDKPYLAISFDDGFKNCTRASKILDEYGIRGCFFVCPSIIGETNQSKIDKFCREGLLVEPSDFLTWDDIENMVKNGHEIGSHTMTHPNIANLTSAEIRNEIELSTQLLKKHLGIAKHFAWPFGRFFHFNRQAVDTVFNAGFESCAAGERGCHIPSGKILNKGDVCTRRDHVIATWPIEHVLFFLARNVKRASPANNYWPNEYNGG